MKTQPEDLLSFTQTAIIPEVPRCISSVINSEKPFQWSQLCTVWSNQRSAVCLPAECRTRAGVKDIFLRAYWTYGDSLHKFALFSFLRSLRGSELPHRSTMGLQRRHNLDVDCGRLICLHQRSSVGGHCKVQETPSSSKLDLGQSCHCWSWRDSFCQHY